ncbi:MAG: imidazole glycerol phosphate synthase subunit HisH [Pseudomonadales bacterium]|jgi:glutamine amidotransferase|nr:imidazole glycerol phosphate synthase subunit HisH [Pseudomonadales bacterium]MDG1443990.1 imidazole glycerol phosphate synthase subunit HisH [Pseudomonadales bacterium]
MRVAIVDYDAGNLRSVQRACQAVGLDGFITASPEEVLAADKIIFPGVGSSVSAVDTLHDRGLFDALIEAFQKGTPLLGICLGSQIVLEHTEEGDKDCLGLIDGVVERFDFADRTYKIPHIGWNEISISQPHPLLRQVEDGDEFYFVHSYFTRPTQQANVIATTDYNINFCSILAKDNLFATQFHLEKSGKKGLSILAEFASWEGGSAC